LLEVPEVVCCVLLCMLEIFDVLEALDVPEVLCRMLLCLLELPDAMHCVLLRMLEAVEGRLCLLEVLELPEAMRCVRGSTGSFLVPLRHQAEALLTKRRDTIEHRRPAETKDMQPFPPQHFAIRDRCDPYLLLN